MEVRFLKYGILCLLFGSSLASCLRDDPIEGYNGSGEDQGSVYTLGTPVSYSTSLEGLSAICLNEAGEGLYVAEDNGHVYEFSLDGQLRSKLSFPSPDDAHDWEGICRTPDGSTIYLCEERLRQVYKLNADHKGVTLVSTGPKESGYQENQGYEGIAAGNGVLYIANQSLPKRVYSFNIASAAWSTVFDFSKASSLSDIFYDTEDGSIWITDAKTNLLTQFKGDGTVIHEYDISFVSKPEGFCKDPVRKQFWFVCDKTSKLYKVSYQ